MRRAWAAALVLLTACGTTPSTPVEAPAVQSAEACPYPESGFDCDFQRRFDQARRYAADRPGATALVVRDRERDVVWRNEHAGDMVWTASTIKLAMAADLLVRHRSGEIELTAGDRADMDAMLFDSDDKAATDLWMRYSGDDHRLFNAHFPGLGLVTLRPQPGYGRVFPYWGFQKCTADDLDRLLAHVLGGLAAEDRAYLVDRMRTVAPNQQWGVWAAGPGARPGAKNGWAEEDTGWVMNSIGFVGPAERYTVVILNDLRGEGGYDEGRETTSEVARLLFAGRF
ncbi:tat pathway signal sequence [Actinokineospora fastidiosa]|nr:tat pathway signal sequence [Actinokineospora fastidiosa]